MELTPGLAFVAGLILAGAAGLLTVCVHGIRHAVQVEELDSACTAAEARATHWRERCLRWERLIAAGANAEQRRALAVARGRRHEFVADEGDDLDLEVIGL